MSRQTLWNQPLPSGPVPEGEALRVALVACGKAKVDHPAQAKDFYTGSLFRMTRQLVEEKYDAWWILSARHYLVHPDDILTPYEAALTNAPDEFIFMWANRVDASFRCHRPGYGAWTQHGGLLHVDIYAGQNYVAPLVERWSSLSWEIGLPLEGLQIGERLAALKAAREHA